MTAWQERCTLNLCHRSDWRSKKRRRLKRWAIVVALLQVQQIRPGGSADQSGSIFKKDVIISINGKALSSFVEHSEIVQVIKVSMVCVCVSLLRPGMRAGKQTRTRPNRARLYWNHIACLSENSACTISNTVLCLAHSAGLY